MSILLRIMVPGEERVAVLEALRTLPGVAEFSINHGASVEPSGDVIQALVVRESADEVFCELERLGVERYGSVTALEPDVVLSANVDAVEAQIPGDGSDAIVWDEVSEHTNEDAQLSWNFVIFACIATMLAGIGIVTNSVIVIVGAMVVGPEFGALAGIALGLVERQWKNASKAALALLVGYPVAMAVVAICTAIALPLGLFHSPGATHNDSAVEFIYQPSIFSFLVALLAGAAGMMSLISKKSSVLVGVFISVTTVPSAGFVAVGLVLEEPAKVAGSAIQLVLNLLGIIISSLVVLMIYRLTRRRQGNRKVSRRSFRRSAPR